MPSMHHATQTKTESKTMDKNEMNRMESKAITDVFNSVSLLIQTMRTDREVRTRYRDEMDMVRIDMGDLRSNFPWLLDEEVPRLTYKPDTGLTMLKEPVNTGLTILKEPIKDTVTKMTEQIDKMTERMSQVHDKIKQLQQKTKTNQ